MNFQKTVLNFSASPKSFPQVDETLKIEIIRVQGYTLKQESEDDELNSCSLDNPKNIVKLSSICHITDLFRKMNECKGFEEGF